MLDWCRGRDQQSNPHDGEDAMMTGRGLLETAAMGTILAGAGSAVPQLFATEADAEVALNLSPMLPEGTRAEATLDTLPGKKPLIKLTYRPPNYESPIEYLRTVIT